MGARKTDLYITSTPVKNAQGENMCLVQWEDWEAALPPRLVRHVGESFFTAAAYAELLHGLVAKCELDKRSAASLVGSLFDPDRIMGSLQAVGLAPALLRDGTPAVVIIREKRKGQIDVAEARETGTVWLEAALAARYDDCMKQALDHATLRFLPEVRQSITQDFFARLQELMTK